ncbi:MAG TPA: substrate-binding domain-containing protein [Chloroflexi bacterium]|nr:substrate-binding domain-containing protein [Chloroflexota bacterium]
MKQQQVKLISLVMVAVFAISLVLAACAVPATAPSAPAGGEAASTDVAAPEAAAPAADSNFKPVWYAPAPHPYFEEVRKGVEAFEAETGIKVEKQIGPDWNQDSQNQRMEALAAQGFNAFSVYPADAVGTNGLYEQLTPNGIHIINFGTSTAQPTTASFAVATDVKAAAMRAAEELIAAMGGKGNIINVLEVLEDPNTALRKQGIDEVVAKYPDVTIIQEVADIKSVEEAVQKVGDALSANIDKVDGIIATGYTPSVAIAQVLSEYKEKGGDRTIHAVGIDTDEMVMQAIKDGVMDGTIVQNPYGHGYLSMLLLQYLSEGYTPKADAYFVDAGFAFATQENLETYNNDILAVTEQIKSELLDKYLEK